MLRIKLHPDQWDIKALQDQVLMQFGMDISAEGDSGTRTESARTGRGAVRRI